MNITIHRGTHEIGGTCIEVTHDCSRIILDLGTPLKAVDGGPDEPFDEKKYKGMSPAEPVGRTNQERRTKRRASRPDSASKPGRNCAACEAVVQKHPRMVASVYLGRVDDYTRNTISLEEARERTSELACIACAC